MVHIIPCPGQRRYSINEKRRAWSFLDTVDNDDINPVIREFTNSIRTRLLKRFTDARCRNNCNKSSSNLGATVRAEGRPYRRVWGLFWLISMQDIRGRGGITVICTGGRNPTAAERQHAIGKYPRLRDGEWKVTGEATCKYNCIEWSLCQDDEWVWPQVDDAGDDDGTVEISDFDEFYQDKGFTICGTSSADCRPECRKRKVALFAKNGEPTHASKEILDGGWWESKRGKNIKIMHKLDQMEGGDYGDVVRCYCKDDPGANLDLCPDENAGGDGE